MGGFQVSYRFPDYFTSESRSGTGRTLTRVTKGPWAEPGYCTELTIEVDEALAESNLQSHRISFAWARHNVPEVVS